MTDKQLAVLIQGWACDLMVGLHWSEKWIIKNTGYNFSDVDPMDKVWGVIEELNRWHNGLVGKPVSHYAEWLENCGLFSFQEEEDVRKDG